MSAAETVIVGQRLPRIRSIDHRAGYEVAVSWDDVTRDGATDIVDLSPLVFRLKFYAPLRDDEALRRSVHVLHGGAAIAWGETDEVDMAAISVLRLAEEAQPASLSAEEEHKLSQTDGRTAAA